MKEILRFLQIDTSNEDYLYVLLHNGDNKDHILLDEKRCHLKELIPSIQNLLNRSNLNLTDLDFIAINEGPGSWTGLRIGFSSVKILCLVNKINLITYSNFEILLNRNLNKHGFYLVKAGNEKYYYLIKNESKLVKTGIATELEILEIDSSLEKFYLKEKDLNCSDMLINKYYKKEFRNYQDVEPYYIGEGVLIK